MPAIRSTCSRPRRTSRRRPDAVIEPSGKANFAAMERRSGASGASRPATRLSSIPNCLPKSERLHLKTGQRTVEYGAVIGFRVLVQKEAASLKRPLQLLIYTMTKQNSSSYARVDLSTNRRKPRSLRSRRRTIQRAIVAEISAPSLFACLLELLSAALRWSCTTIRGRQRTTTAVSAMLRPGHPLLSQFWLQLLRLRLIWCSRIIAERSSSFAQIADPRLSHVSGQVVAVSAGGPPCSALQTMSAREDVPEWYFAARRGRRYACNSRPTVESTNFRFTED